MNGRSSIQRSCIIKLINELRNWWNKKMNCKQFIWKGKCRIQTGQSWKKIGDQTQQYDRNVLWRWSICMHNQFNPPNFTSISSSIATTQFCTNSTNIFTIPQHKHLYRSTPGFNPPISFFTFLPQSGFELPSFILNSYSFAPHATLLTI